MTPTPTSAPDAGTTRRQLLRTGALGAAAAAFLAACGTDSESPAGQSGVDPTTTVVTPTVPLEEPSDADLVYETTLLRTATSLELVAAAAYADFGPDLTDPELVATVARFQADHEANAAEFLDRTPPDARYDEPNSWVQEELIDPSADLMTSDRAILALMEEVESMLAATLLVAVPSVTTGELRSLFTSVGAASARRTALLSNGGEGSAPTGALYPTTDLISNDAYLPVDAPVEEAADATTEGDTEPEAN